MRKFAEIRLGSWQDSSMSWGADKFRQQRFDRFGVLPLGGVESQHAVRVLSGHQRRFCIGDVQAERFGHFGIALCDCARVVTLEATLSLGVVDRDAAKDLLLQVAARALQHRRCAAGIRLGTGRRSMTVDGTRVSAELPRFATKLCALAAIRRRLVTHALAPMKAAAQYAAALHSAVNQRSTAGSVGDDSLFAMAQPIRQVDARRARLFLVAIVR